jgi:asparagine synthase (glutamine-hydrolysing)
MCHERLSIIDLSTGTQPIQGTDSAWVMHNGEIYNHMDLRKGELADRMFRTSCDSEVIVHLYEKYGSDFCNMLDGIFAFVVIDGYKFMAGRDPIGVKPLYYGYDKEGRMYFTTEMKVIADQCVKMEAFPPGHFFTPETGFVRYYNPEWADEKVCTNDFDPEKLRNTLIWATEKRLMSDVPLGVLLSGGLDSSLIASITKRAIKNPKQELHSFSVGFYPEAPDLKYAKQVADFIGTTHHEVIVSIDEGIAALEKVIWHLETYDITTIRAATPMYFLSKYITDMGIKVVLSGEGADEIFGGYLYFHNAPSDIEFQKETISRVFRLSTADCLRADKATMAHGLEARVPFLDKGFLKVAMAIDPKFKRPDKPNGKMEKWILRKAFDTKDNPYLPDEILWRQKEQFSDGVGYSWIDTVKAYCDSKVSDEEFATAEKRFPYNTPDTKEAFYFRTIFERYYPQEHCIKTVLKWIPKWQKNTDPSGRAAQIHVNTIEKK